MTAEVTYLRACDKAIFRTGILKQRQNTTEKQEFWAKYDNFSIATDS